jgi:PD-(D/E)XK nuclease superfamily
MPAFLEAVAQKLLAAHGPALQEVAVVLPNRRAASYLRKYLAHAHGAALWSPRMHTVETFLEQLSGLRQVRGLELLFQLQAVRAELGHGQDILDLLQAGGDMVADMVEVDAHLVPHELFYRDLRNLEALEEWSLRLGTLSQGQTRFMQQWERMGQVHARFNERLIQQGLGHSGLVQRTAHTRVVHQGQGVPWPHVWLVGMNALAPSAAGVLQHLLAKGRLRAAWDVDQWWLTDTRQEAGHWVRKAMHTFGAGEIPPGQALIEQPRTMRVVGCNNSTAMVLRAADVIAALTEEERTRTVIALADEQLLLPLLAALPVGLGAMNVTMGLPLNLTHGYSLLQAISLLHADLREESFPAEQLRTLFGHPLLINTARSVRLAMREEFSVHHLRVPVSAALRIARALPTSIADHAAECLAPPKPSAQGLVACLQAGLRWAMAGAERDAFEREALYAVTVAFEHFALLLQQAAVPIDARGCAVLLARALRSERLDLMGEPLAGLQIMGMLETRAIHADRLVVLGAEEGVLPPVERATWMPGAVRQAYGLPNKGDSEALSAYTFQRLLASAKEVTLLHRENMDAGGASRYIAQLEQELVPISHTTIVHERELPTPELRPITGVAVRKDETTLLALREKCRTGLSPTALGSFLSCPLDFYYQQLLRMARPAENVARVPEHILGTALHKVLQNVLQPWLGNRLQGDVLMAAAENIGAAVRAAFEEQVGLGRTTKGQVHLQLAMSVEALQRYLRFEAGAARRTTIQVLHVEHAMRAELPHSEQVLLKGVADRVDLRDGLHTLIDVKTGRVTDQQVRLKSLRPEDLGSNDTKALQLLVYAWLYLRTNPHVDRLQALLLPLGQASQYGGMALTIDKEHILTRDRMPEMENLFARLLQRILDPKEPFTHLAESTNCRFCLGPMAVAPNA